MPYSKRYNGILEFHATQAEYDRLTELAYGRGVSKSVLLRAAVDGLLADFDQQGETLAHMILAAGSAPPYPLPVVFLSHPEQAERLQPLMALGLSRSAILRYMLARYVS